MVAFLVVVLLSFGYFSVTLNEAKTSRPRPELWGRGQGQDYVVEAKAEAKNNYEKVPNND